MEFMMVRKEKTRWAQIRAIYQEAFPKREQKPFFVLKREVKRGKVQLIAAVEGADLLGFVTAVPFRDLVMVDYLVANRQVRGKGTGSKLLEQVRAAFPAQTQVLLIERLDPQAPNRTQREDRKRFYERNGFSSSGLFVSGAGGEMEVLQKGGIVSGEAYLAIQRHALGRLLFRLSGIRLTDGDRP